MNMKREFLSHCVDELKANPHLITQRPVDKGLNVKVEFPMSQT